jgi:hypothetical protein
LKEDIRRIELTAFALGVPRFPIDKARRGCGVLKNTKSSRTNCWQHGGTNFREKQVVKSRGFYPYKIVCIGILAMRKIL